MKLNKIPCNLPIPTDSSDFEVFRSDDGDLVVFKTIDNTPKWGKLKHVSISRRDRYPSWEEILEIKEQLFGDIDVGMIMPKKEDYVNVHNFCFHLWQLPERWELR